MYVDDIKLTGKKQNLDPMWKLQTKEVDFGEPTSFLDHVYLGVLYDTSKKAKPLWTKTEPCSNREFLRGRGEKNQSLKTNEFFHG